MRVLVFGASGQVARALGGVQWTEGTTLIQLDRTAADLSHPEQLPAIVRQHAPDAVVVAAAYTQVDKAESEEALATTVNGLAPGEIASAAAALSIPIIHLSTDYVFNGEKAEPYVESDSVAPICAYGRSKLAGEMAVRQANPRHLILRTSWIYDAFGANFLRTMLRLAESRDEVRVVDDQQGCPTAASDVAEAIARALPYVTHRQTFGTYHVAGGSSATWHGFAESIFEQLAARGLRRPRNIPIKTSEYPTPARRPKNSRLASDAFAAEFNFRLPGYETALPKVLDAAVASLAASEATGKRAAR